MASIEDKKEQVIKVLEENKGRPLEEIIVSNPDIFRGNIKELASFVMAKYKEINGGDGNGQDNDVSSNKQDEDILLKEISGLKQVILEQQKSIQEQQKKIQEHDKTIADVVEVIKAFAENPQAVLGAVNSQDSSQDSPVRQEEPVSQPSASQSPSQPVQKLPFDKVNEFLRNVALVANAGAPPQQASPNDVVSNITSSVGIATQIVSALGEGLGKMFEAFNGMQERSTKMALSLLKSQMKAGKGEKE